MTLNQFNQTVRERKYIEKAIERIRGRIVETRERAERITTTWDAQGRGAGFHADPVGEAIAQVKYYEALLADYELKLVRKEKEIEALFDRVEDPPTRLALKYKYVDGGTWFKIAAQLGDDYTGDGVRMMCKRYLEKFF